VNRIDQETEKRRGPTRAVEPFKEKKKKNEPLCSVKDREFCDEVIDY
jgi:hypothetical protein